MSALEQFEMNGKVALVTGGAGLLGPVFGAALAEAGACVILADLNEAKGRAVLSKLPAKLRKRIAFAAMDASDPASVRALVDGTVEKHGRIDVLINGAIGVGKTHFAPFEKYTWEDWNQVMTVSVGGTFLCCQAAGRHMKRQKSGSIINIGSIYGVVGADQRIYGKSGINSAGVYAASKGAILSLTRYLSVYWAPFGIRVNSISPGGVYNQQDPFFIKNYSHRAPMGRMLKKEELRGAVLYLASEASSYVTGHNLLVDGGWTAW
ncbi:MAG: SDR family oxidoreductase [Candidatus Omnitrophica bacterium]|nr:SDR family oxidoreductase [Candidatus Omnitrophota bacterium]